MRLCALFAALCGAIVLPPAASADDFYADKQLAVVIGSSAGGGQDAYGRLVARHLVDHIPGGPVAVPQNLPGAAGRTALRSLDKSQPTDGTAVVTFTAGLVVQSLVKPEDTPIDFRDFAWIGSVGREPRVCFMWSGTGMKTWADVLARDTIALGDTGGGGQTHLTARVLQEMFGVKINLILGYPGVTEKRLAIERGELDGDCGTLASIPPEWISDGKVNVVLRLQDQLMPGVADDVPFIGDLAKDDPGKRRLLELLNAATELGRPFVVSDQVPADRVAILRAAFAAMTTDPDFLAEAAHLRLDVTPIAGAALEATIGAIYETQPEVVAAARELMAE